MKTTKLMAALLAAAMMTAGGSLLPVSAETETTWKYENCGDYITITGGDVNASTLIIPEEIDGLPVTCIDSCAFEQYTALTSVVIPDSVTTIGESAFAECGTLVTVVLPEGVEAILGSTFYGCTPFQHHPPRYRDQHRQLRLLQLRIDGFAHPPRERGGNRLLRIHSMREPERAGIPRGRNGHRPVHVP